MNNDISTAQTSFEEITPPNCSSTKSMTRFYISKAKKCVRLTDEEVIELSKLKDAGDIDAKNKLIESNLMLVISIVKKFNISGALDEDELIQDGNLGLIKAVEKFDYTKGIKFSTYATYWIKQSIRREAAEKSKIIRLPVYKDYLFYKIIKFETEFLQENGREPNWHEISNHFNIDIETLIHIKLSRSLVSLYSPLKKSDSDDVIGDFIADNSSKQGFENVDHIDLKKSLLKSISEILTNEREFLVIVKRFGLEDGQSRSLEEVGDLLGVTRERVRQLEVNALRRLRRNQKFIEDFQYIL